MATTTLTVKVNYVDADVSYLTTPSNYITMDITKDYFIWTKGNAIVKDLMTFEPTGGQLNAAAELIDPLVAVTVSKCLFMDYSHDVGGNYFTHLIKGMGENKKYVFCFSFDGATATEPQLEAWDNASHNIRASHVLGAGSALNSMLKGVCTTTTNPGASWVGVPIAGSDYVLLLNNGAGAIGAPESATLSTDLYANLKIVIPANYTTPAAETFVLTVRYTYL